MLSWKKPETIGNRLSGLGGETEGRNSTTIYHKEKSTQRETHRIVTLDVATLKNSRETDIMHIYSQKQHVPVLLCFCLSAHVCLPPVPAHIRRAVEVLHAAHPWQYDGLHLLLQRCSHRVMNWYTFANSRYSKLACSSANATLRCSPECEWVGVMVCLREKEESKCKC